MLFLTTKNENFMLYIQIADILLKLKITILK